MSNKNSNFPSNQLNHVEEGVCAEIVDNLRQLNALGKPQTIEELQKRIDVYFQFCAEHDFRPGVETLCLALSVTRQTLWKWCIDDTHGEEWGQTCRNAKQFILAFLEEATLKGKLNPASSIFYLKNWASYRDVVEVEPPEPQKRILSADEALEMALRMGQEEAVEQD